MDMDLFFLDRLQRVKIDNHFASHVQPKGGAVQGTAVGPVVFLLNNVFFGNNFGHRIRMPSLAHWLTGYLHMYLSYKKKGGGGSRTI